ncbi:hypothetical protein [Pseudopedobacter sp.]|uniref:hypothetical protein n=1 Tax=Pseudopedobacter sp. TaxID=1936787 RepID=UPI003341D1BC
MEDKQMENQQEAHKEGPVARKIEEQTARLPSDVFLWASLASMGMSLTLKCLKHKHMALFVGQWAAPFLLLGIYNKIVKTSGHDEQS